MAKMTDRELKLKIIELMPNACISAWKAAYNFITSEEETPVTCEEKERHAIVEALERHNGNRLTAAKELGISERTIYRKIKQYEIQS